VAATVGTDNLRPSKFPWTLLGTLVRQVAETLENISYGTPGPEGERNAAGAEDQNSPEYFQEFAVPLCSYSPAPTSNA
jgi:hypothetical protein